MCKIFQIFVFEKKARTHLYSEADVFESYCGDSEIYYIDINNSLIELTFSTLYSSTTFKNVTFNNMTFERSYMVNYIFENYIFIKCEFTYSSYRDCKLDINVINSNFDEIFFQGYMIPVNRFDRYIHSIILISPHVLVIKNF